MDSALPTADEFFSQPSADDKAPLPSADEFFAQKPSAYDLTMNMLRAPAGTVANGQFNLPPETQAWLKGTSVGRILNAFGQGAGDQIQGDVGLSPETVQEFRKAGIYNDYAKGDSDMNKWLLEGVVTPAAAAVDSFFKVVGSGIEGTSGAVQQGLKEVGLPGPAGALGELTDYAMTTPALAEAGHESAAKQLPPEIADARHMAVIGEGEEGYFGTKDPTPEDITAREAAAPEINSQPATPEEPAQASAAEAPEEQPTDIHTTVREQSPQLFNEYDRLSNQKDVLSGWMRDFAEKRQSDAEANAPHNEEIADLQAKIEDANPRKAKIYQDQLDDLNERNSAAIADVVSQDTPDIKQVRERLQQIDYRMRDLAPDVSEAYRKAQEQMPEVPPEKAGSQQTPSEPENVAQGTTAETQAEEPPATAEELEQGVSQKPIEEQRQAIIDDLTQKLTAVGRPKEEADAAAQLEAARYETLAQQYPKFTAEEWYNREGANVRAGKERVRQLAQNPEEGTELAQSQRGKIRLATDDAKATITLMKSANASTFIHEKGHEWADQLLRLADESDAPAQLKADAETLRKYGGAGEDGVIPTRGHEKIARGFERYLMEGTAPSKALAGVFAKLKQWLTGIYKTVDALRSPISDDIRDVFDRLLSASPEKTVIAPDVEPGKLMADIHEADAAETAPENAAEARDNIRAEVNQTAKAHAPEIYDGLKSAEAQRVETEAPVSEPSGSEPEPSAGNAGAGDSSGAVNRGGDRSGPEGDRLRPDPELVDKAGNIRLDNLNTPEDINQVLRETAATNGDFLEARRGVMSDAQVLELSDAIGMDPAFLNRRKIGEAFNAEQIMAARKLLIKSAESVRDAATKAADGTDADALAYAEARSRHAMIQEHVSGITAEAGRALRAFRELEGQGNATAVGEFLKSATGKDLFQLKEEAKLLASLETPEQVSKFVHDTSSGKLKNAIIEYYVNCLISGPITHMRYAVGNAVNALWTPLVQIPVASAIGVAREAITGEGGDRVHLGEAGAQLYAMAKGARDGWAAGAKAFETGISPLLPGEHVSSNFADVRTNAIPGTFGKVMNVPSRSVAAIHSFFKSMRYEQNIAGLAYREAAKQGLEGADFEAKVAELTKSPTPEMMKQASEQAMKNLYMAPTDYHSAMGALTRFTNQSLVAKVIVPFMKIGSQITREAFIEQSPLGVFSQEVRDNLSGKNGGAAQDFQAAKITAGIGLMSATALLVAEGNATGDGPTDPKQRAVWLLSHTPNTLKIGNLSIPYQGLGSLGMLMRFSANMTETAQGWKSEDGEKLAMGALEGLTKSVLDENFMRGVKDLLDAVYHPEEYGARYLQDFVTNWLPFSVGMAQVARTVDPDRRMVKSYGLENAWGIFDSARAKIPGLSETLYPRRDVFGTPIPNSGTLQDYSNDPVVNRLQALNIGIGPLEHKIRGVALDDAQFDAYSAMAGRMTKQRLDMIIKPGFELAPAGPQIEVIDKAISKSREAARSIIMMQNPDIIQQATQAKRKLLQ